MELADDTAYGVHDLEDGIALGLISHEHWEEIKNEINSDWVGKWELNNVGEQLFNKSEDSNLKRKQAIGALVNSLINSVETENKKGFGKPLFKYNVCFESETKNFLETLKK